MFVGVPKNTHAPGTRRTVLLRRIYRFFFVTLLVLRRGSVSQPAMGLSFNGHGVAWHC